MAAPSAASLRPTTNKSTHRGRCLCGSGTLTKASPLSPNGGAILVHTGLVSLPIMSARRWAPTRTGSPLGRVDQDHSGGGDPAMLAHRRRGAYPHSPDRVAARSDGVGALACPKVSRHDAEK